MRSAPIKVNLGVVTAGDPNLPSSRLVMGELPWERVYIGLGSNLEDPLSQVESAVSALSTQPSIRLIQTSPWYRSVAIGPGEQPDYINGVVAIETQLSASDLLSALHQIEANHGRIRRQRWAARTLDMDILLYGNRTITTDRLQIPHPRLHERNFVLYPLADLTPNLVFPDGQLLTTLVAACSREGITPLTPPGPKH